MATWLSFIKGFNSSLPTTCMTLSTDEFGTPFEVTNCSICLHWVTSGEQGAMIFSAGYNGCHVQKKVRGVGTPHPSVPEQQQKLEMGPYLQSHSLCSWGALCLAPTESLLGHNTY